ncbi:hypothetical protein [Caloranaerobacter azorensis]|nr:hypothetical protein [Caloranaerobacter azorensis]
MAINNKCGWITEFAAATSVLEIKTGLTRRTIERARNELKQKGRINWKSRKGNQSAVYTIIPFVRNDDAQSVAQPVAQSVAQSVAQTIVRNDDAQSVAQPVAQSVAQTIVRNNDAQSVAQKCIVRNNDAQSVAQTISSSNTNTNINTNTSISSSNTNTNINTNTSISSSSTTTKKNMGNFNTNKYFKELAKLYEQCICTPDELTADWIESILEMYSFEWCKNAILEAKKRGYGGKGYRTKKYVEGILQNWKRDGGMKLKKDNNNSNKDSNKTFQTRFHNFEQRTSKYTAEELDRIAREKFERKLREVKR